MDKELEKNQAEEPETAEAAVTEEAVEEVQKPEPKAEKAPDVQETAEKTSHKRVLQGTVVSSKPDKTILVLIERQIAHPLYKKYYKRAKKVMAHDENNDCNVGDLVKVIESRPLSKRKRWRMVEILERAK